MVEKVASLQSSICREHLFFPRYLHLNVHKVICAYVQYLMLILLTLLPSEGAETILCHLHDTTDFSKASKMYSKVKPKSITLKTMP